jgi:formylglycine-generating enzyme required for sulfatase activity
MGRIEVTWNEFEAWYRATGGEGRTDIRQLRQSDIPGIDAVTGATPPYGAPDQGWGKGDRPAITMTFHAATEYCKWLSEVTGKKYRLPTEAEWEYACRAGTDTPYFFEGDPKQYSERRFWNRIVGVKSEGIDPFVIHAGNSGGRTMPASETSPNLFGLINMSGNVREFCLDWYADDAYERYPEGTVILDPKGPDSGIEHVIRGGSFRSDASAVRSAARDHTRHDAWLVTDPQIPKSVWWYSDCIDVGFRVVCEYEGESG